MPNQRVVTHLAGAAQADVYGICNRCGQAIKNILVWGGLEYGPDCFEVVSGERAERYAMRREGGYMVARVEEQDVERQVHAAERAAAEAIAEREAEARREAVRQENEWLICVLREQRGDFCASLVEELSNGRRVADLPGRCQSILCDIYAKAHGRGGSKANRAAEAEFWARAFPGEEEAA